MFPLDGGGWRVFRFSPGCSEANTWEQDREGWTNCFYNCKPNLATAARSLGGQEDPEQGGYIFDTAEEAIKAAHTIGQNIEQAIDLPKPITKRKSRLTMHKDGRLIMHIFKKAGEKDKNLKGWISKKDKWTKIFNVWAAETKRDDYTHGEYDHVIRQLVTPSNEDAGWYLKADDNTWQRFSTEKVKLRFTAMGHSDHEIKIILGSTIGKAWKLVNIPFQSEYPGDRQWNMDAAQFSCQPIILADGESPHHPCWDKIFNDTFRTLTPYLKNLSWAREAGIFTGGDYARHWFARLLRDPFEPLPYLFLYGEEDSGKSIIHEAASKLMTKGVVKGDRALSTKGDFNGELANAVLCVVEEKDMSKDSHALDRIREWVTNRSLSIRKMRTDTYEQPSTLHFIQCSNWFQACPIFPGDTRATVIHVPRFEGTEIPKKIMLAELEKEAPHFLRTLLDLKLPPSTDRLGLPFVETEDKAELADEVAPINRFLVECCELKEGARVIKKELFESYSVWAMENGYDGLCIGEFGKQLMAVSNNRIRAKGQKTDKNGKLKHTYEGVSLANAV